jgi:hypothetical protein
MNFQDKEYYWLLPKDTQEWEIGKCEKIHRMGFQPDGFQFLCADSGYLTPDDCEDIRRIERPE